MDREEWRPIQGTGGKYEVSSLGKVKSYVIKKTGKLLAQQKNGRYIQVHINKKKISLHRLVYQHFHGPLEKGKIVHHIDGDTLNCRADNLEQITQRKNVLNSWEGRSSSVFPGVHRRGKRWSAQILIDKLQIYLGSFDTEEEAAMAYLVKLKEYQSNK